MKHEPDWSRTGTIVAYAEWLRKKAGAFAVIVVRRDDAALSSDEAIAPMDVRDLVETACARMVDDILEARKSKRPGARSEYGPMPE